MQRVPKLAMLIVIAMTSLAPGRAFATDGSTELPTPSRTSPSSILPPASSPKGAVSPMATPGGCANKPYYSMVVSTTLSNGNLNTRFCVNAALNVKQVHTVYEKTGGSPVTLRNFWEWTSPAGGTSGDRHYDSGAFTATAGHMYPYAWTYDSAVKWPKGYACVRGGVRDINRGLDYTTRVFCAGS